ncbi:MAG: hypothetical protein ACHQQQ_07365 [Bacteroidota bacterium]
MTFSCAAVLIAMLLLLPSCHHSDEPPVQPKTTMQLTATDTGVVYARLRVQVTYTNIAYSLMIKRDSSSIFTSPQSLTDTTVVDTALLPKHTYNYKAYALANGRAIDSSGQLAITTMDTTSHNIIWQMYTLGDGNSSILKDVCIVNDTCVWAVGEISLRDSTGQWDTKPYGAAYWNGSKWSLIKVPYHDYGTTITYPGPLRAVFAFNSTSVYVASYANLLKWDGNSWQEKAFVMTGIPFNGQINKIWGINEHQIYMVGNSGAIFYYNGASVIPLQSGTTLDIQDIWGAQDKNGNWEILAAAGNYYISNERKILSIKGTTVIALSDSGINWALSSVWFKPGKQYWMVGTGLWEKNYSLNSSLWKGGPNIITTFTTNRIRATDINDIFICGSFGDLVHFNGVSWHSYYEQTQLYDGAFYSIVLNGNLIIAVGEDNPLAAVAIGKWN